MPRNNKYDKKKRIKGREGCIYRDRYIFGGSIEPRPPKTKINEKEKEKEKERKKES